MTVDVHPTLAEYTSREARYRLVQLCLDKINEEQSRRQGDTAATKVLADRLYVSQRTVQRWARGGIQSCNVNADAIINVALGLDPFDTAKILARDLDHHRRELIMALPRGALEGEIQVTPDPRSDPELIDYAKEAAEHA